MHGYRLIEALILKTFKAIGRPKWEEIKDPHLVVVIKGLQTVLCFTKLQRYTKVEMSLLTRLYKSHHKPNIELALQNFLEYVYKALLLFSYPLQIHSSTCPRS